MVIGTDFDHMADNKELLCVVFEIPHITSNKIPEAFYNLVKHTQIQSFIFQNSLSHNQRKKYIFAKFSDDAKMACINMSGAETRIFQENKS